MSDETFLQNLAEKLDDLKCDLSFYLERVIKIHRYVIDHYKKYTGIRAGDEIAPETIECEKQFRVIVRDLIKVQEFMDSARLKDKHVEMIRRRARSRVEYVINSIPKNTDSFVFNYVLKRKVSSFIDWYTSESKNIDQARKKYGHNVNEEEGAGTEAVA